MQCGNSTMVPSYNALLAYRAVALLNMRRVPGDIVELGVWRGGLSCFMAMSQLTRGGDAPSRRMWLFDTFEGMPEPTVADGASARRIWRRVTNGTQLRAPGTVRERKWAYGPLEEVQHTIARSGYSPERVSYVKGKVEETLPAATLPTSIALLRLDTDFYTSTKIELDRLWPLLSPGGWMYVDDYGAFQGARRAVDEWLNAKKWMGHARMAKAFKRARNHPRGATEDQLGSFFVWKARPYSDQTPFDVRNESVNALAAEMWDELGGCSSSRVGWCGSVDLGLGHRA